MGIEVEGVRAPLESISEGDTDGEGDVDTIEDERCGCGCGHRRACAYILPSSSPSPSPSSMSNLVAPLESRAVPWRWSSAGAGAGVLLASQSSQILVEKHGSVYVLPSPSSAPPHYAYANVRDPRDSARGGWRIPRLSLVCVCGRHRHGPVSYCTYVSCPRPRPWPLRRRYHW
jgi:hypothetical protein